MTPVSKRVAQEAVKVITHTSSLGLSFCLSAGAIMCRVCLQTVRVIRGWVHRESHERPEVRP